MSSLYEQKIDTLKGIGEKKAQLFRKLGVFSIGDLIELYPRSYQDWSTSTNISDLKDNETFVIRATVATPFTENYVKTGKFISKCMVCDDSGGISLTFFNNKYISSMLKFGEEYYFYGKVNKGLKGYSMVSPTFSSVKEGASLHPIYPLTAGLNNRFVTSAVKNAISLLPDEIPDPLPKEICEKYNLMGYREALINIHFPKYSEDMQKARQRLIVEELVVLMLGMSQLKQAHRQQCKVQIKQDYTREFLSLLQFELTNAQRRVINECLDDMINGNHPMNRLVQGDVGSGKTAVAGAVCYSVINNGYQCAFMAPTEILATQHYKSFCNLFSTQSSVKVGLLTGSMKEKEKHEVREQLKNGEIDLIVGTHALITDKTEFLNLGLAVTDEQHRFGVEQRGSLISKGDNPHTLVMSATPIPRTLALIIYGNLDISIIDELPKGRKKVETLLIDSSIRRRALNFIKKNVANGQQAYIVCPLVEESENIDHMASAEEYAEKLMLEEFSNVPVGILHGKMKPTQKDMVMKQFAQNELSVLVSTTVIEVGVDVPNATIMMIENSERFGLSQLHQLRGRVGRGSEKSYCILITDEKNVDTNQRLKMLCSTNDGFKIAEYDMKLRGPGDFFGSRQHGLPELKLADITDTTSLSLAQNIVKDIVDNSFEENNDKYRLLKGEIKRLYRRIGENGLN